MSHLVRDPFVVTTFAQRSGDGTPMFSRPGVQTISQYMCFKDQNHHEISEAPELALMTEEDKRLQVKNDLLGKDTDVYRQRIMKEHRVM